MSFANLKTNRTDVSKLVSAVQEASGATTQKKSYEDERFWKPTVDESGNGYAIIRSVSYTHLTLPTIATV